MVGLMLLLLGAEALLVLFVLLASHLEWFGFALGENQIRPAEIGGTVTARTQALLKDVLDEREYTQLMTRGFLDVPSPTVEDRIYRIRRCDGRVTLYEHGKAVLELCVQPVEPLPSGDVVVLHKVMIEGNESQYLATANRLPSLFRGQCYRP